MPTTARTRTEQLAAFYTAHAHDLRSLVNGRCHAPAYVVEDACQIAWTILLRRPDVTLDQRGLSWLATVATHEAWRLAAAREIPVGTFQGSTAGHDRELPEPRADDDSSAEAHALDRVEHAERRELLATLKPREREALLLHAAGHTYKEIAGITGASYTAVNRRITEGRAALRAGGRRPRTPTASERRITS